MSWRPPICVTPAVAESVLRFFELRGRTVVAVAVIYLAFLGLWGLNYRRVPLERKLGFDAGALTAEAARSAALAAVSHVNALHAQAHATGWPPGDQIDPSLARAFSEVARDLGASANTIPGRPKHTLLNLYFRPAAVDGATDPFFLETLLASELLPFERPFVVAHEWSHLAGFADEGEANFMGWLTSVRGDVPAQYSGWLFLYEQLSGALSRRDREDVASRLAAGPRADLRAIAARLTRDVRPQVSEAGWRVLRQVSEGESRRGGGRELRAGRASCAWHCARTAGVGELRSRLRRSAAEWQDRAWWRVRRLGSRRVREIVRTAAR